MLLDKIGLKHPALTKMAGVLRGTDSGRLKHVPEAASLFAFLVGLSKLHRSDTAQMEAGLNLYDALYLWARDELKESHGWPHEYNERWHQGTFFFRSGLQYRQI